MKKAIIVVFASIILTTLTACATAPTTEPTLKSTKVTMEPATSQTVKSDSNSLEARVQNVQYNPDTKSYQVEVFCSEKEEEYFIIERKEKIESGRFIEVEEEELNAPSMLVEVLSCTKVDENHYNVVVNYEGKEYNVVKWQHYEKGDTLPVKLSELNS